MEDTIAAISTPPGEGGVGIVRLSGPEAIAIAARIFVSSGGKAIRSSRQRVFYGHIRGMGGEVLDEVLLHVMRAPHSYTREDVVEINCHGGMLPLSEVLDETLRQGARPANPGEFTLRAFLNGRIDLVQAEAVIDQIRARTHAGLQAANAAAAGTLSKALHEMHARLAHALAHIEAAVDFADEDLPELVNAPLFEQLRGVHRRMEELLRTADAGRLYREGAAAAIVGRPNVGKSSLFNALLRDARAIVSAQPGTTRDRIEEYITLEGIPLKLIDTAGLRSTQDEVERIGVHIARQALESAQVVLFVLDVSQPFKEEDRELAEELRGIEAPVVAVLNKIDACPEPDVPEWVRSFGGWVKVSAVTGEGLKALEERLVELLLGGVHLNSGEALITRAHQKDSLRRAADCLERLLQDTTVSPEFLAFEMREALGALGEITGETTPEDLLGIIFSNFCIGK